MSAGTSRRRRGAASAALVFLLAAVGVTAAGPASALEAAAPPLLPSPSWTALPGALPPGFRYRYNDRFQGWPVNPGRDQQPIRGSFLDPRGNDNDARGGYHFGVDINVDDARPDPGAPKGLSHRVYALESGIVSARYDRADACPVRRLEVAHFSYWHTSPTVRPGQRVRAGQQIGWTCTGEWHTHLSEWQLLGGKRVWVNPLHAGGKLTPYVDTAPPVVAELRVVSPSPRPWRPTHDLTQPDGSVVLPLDRVRGKVELRARIGDPQTVLGFLARDRRLETDFVPYRVAAEIRRMTTGRVVLRRISYQADQLPEKADYLVHYAPGTKQNLSMGACVGPPPEPDCRGVYWFRPLSRSDLEVWDTRRVPNGRYRVTVYAWDLRGNVGSRTAIVRVAN